MAHWWNHYPWRMIQPNFREIDTQNFDEERFLQELDSFSCNVVMLNAAGLIASYDTDLEDHQRSSYLDGFDLRHLVEKCHEKGIRVIARTDFSKIPAAVFERHPDWAYRHADGTELNYNGYVQTCLNGGYQGAYMDEIIREMFSKIPFDGIYINMGSATGYVVDYSMKRHEPCHCGSCMKAFREKTGMEVPVQLRPGDRASMTYIGWQMQIASAQKKRITQLVREVAPEAAYCSIDYSRQEAHTEFRETLPGWHYRASSCARAMRGMDVEATVADVDFMGFAYRHTSCTPALQELRLWQTLANFSGIDYYVIGRLYDKTDQSAFKRVKRIFSYAKEHEDLMYGADSVSDVLLVRESYIVPNKEEWGFVRILTELHILFDETLTSGLAKKDLGRYKVIILPEKNRLQPAVKDMLDAYVEKGGIVVCTGAGAPLESCGLASPGKVQRDLLGAMFSFDEKETDNFTSMKDRRILITGSTYVENEYAEGTEKYGSYCEPERFGPPELCYADKEPTSFPAVTRFSYGKGFGITLPWHPGTNYYEDGHEGFRLIIGDVLRSLCGVQSTEVFLSPMVEVTHGRKGDTDLIHFVNGSGHFGNSYFEPPVLSDQTMEIEWPWSNAFCENIDEPGNVTCELSDGRLKITVPRLGFHACIKVTH